MRQVPRAGSKLPRETAPVGLSAELVAASIEAFIRERYRVAANDVKFSRKRNLWDDGYIDSIGVVELIVFVETRFSVVMPDEALFDPEFTSIDGIARIVRRLSLQRTT